MNQPTADASIPFAGVDDVRERLGAQDYLPSTPVATAVYLAEALGKPLLVEGPAGVGKTELAKAVASATGRDLIRLQCYEGVDEARALYEWNHAKQLLRITAAHGDTGGDGSTGWDELRTDIFTDEFLLPRPLLAAIRSERPVTLLIDELDKADVEIEGLLLEILSDFQVTVPELGTLTARHRPFVVLTSNATRDLSEALRRRCLFLHIDYPDAELEQRIVALRAPGADAALASAVVRLTQRLRELRLRKSPSVSETVDWARTLVALGATSPEEALDATRVRDNLGVLLKHQDDIERAIAALEL